VVEVRQKRRTSLADVHISSVIEEPIPVEVVGVLRERALFTVAVYSTPTPPAGGGGLRSFEIDYVTMRSISR